MSDSEGMTAVFRHGMRRDKAAISSGCKSHPADRDMSLLVVAKQTIRELHSSVVAPAVIGAEHRYSGLAK